MSDETALTNKERERFDDSVERCLNVLPPEIAAKLEEVPLIVLDEPDDAMMRELGFREYEFDQAAGELCGLHTGVPLTDRAVDSSELPDMVHLFRLGLWNLAIDCMQEEGIDFDDVLDREVRITILHELGHHFGLDEDDLERLGYA